MKLVYIVPLFEMALGSKVSCLGCRQQQWFFSWSCLWRWNETEALLWLFVWKHHQKTFACACLFVQEEKSSPSNVFCEWIFRDVTALMTTANSKSKYSNTAMPPPPFFPYGHLWWSISALIQGNILEIKPPKTRSRRTLRHFSFTVATPVF